MTTSGTSPIDEEDFKDVEIRVVWKCSYCGKTWETIE